MKKKLVKSNNKILTGSLAGVANYLKIDPTIVRVIFSLTLFFSFGTTIILYILMALIIPDGEPATNQFNQFGNHRDSGERPRKEAEKVDEDKEWSDY